MDAGALHAREARPDAPRGMSANAIAAGELERLMTTALRQSGATPAMAAATARALVVAELEGIASHGASRIPQYCGHLRNGRANGSAVPVVSHDRKAACVVDAKQGLAFEACALAAHEAVRRAREFGVAFVCVANSNHFGVAAFHLEPVVAAGLVVVCPGQSPPALAPFGGYRRPLRPPHITARVPRRLGVTAIHAPTVS